MTDIAGQKKHWSRDAATFITVFVLACCLLALHRYARGFMLTSGDDFGRLGYSMEWARQPFLATSDHLWLTGNFALLGSVIAVAKDPMEGLVAFGLLSWVALGGALFYFTRVFRFPVWGGLVGAVLFLVSPLVPPLLLTSMPDVFFWALIIASGTATMQALMDRNVGVRVHLVALLLVSLAGTIRYEAWIFAFFSVLGLSLWMYGEKRRGSAVSATLLLLGALPFIFPLFWVLSSARELGGAFQFAANSHNPLWRHYSWGGEFRLDPGSVSSAGGRLRDACFLLQWLWTLGWGAVILCCGVAIPGVSRRLRIALVLPAVWMVTVCSVAAISGVSGNASERLVAVALALLTVISVGVVAEIVRNRFAGKFWVYGTIGAAIIVLFTVQRRTGAAHTNYRPHKALSTSAITTGWRMRYEFGPSSEYLEGVSHHEMVHLWTSLTRAENGEIHAITALSGDPFRFEQEWDPVPPLENWHELPANLILTADIPQAVMFDEGYVQLFAEGDYTLWARRGILSEKTDPLSTVGGTTEEPTLVQPEFGLEWAMVAPAEFAAFGRANHLAEEYIYAGKDDWRLPTIDELWKISAYTTDNEPGFDARLTPRDRFYWSSTPGRDEDTRKAVDFTRLFPMELPTSSSAGVRPVRNSTMVDR